MAVILMYQLEFLKVCYFQLVVPSIALHIDWSVNVKIIICLWTFGPCHLAALVSLTSSGGATDFDMLVLCGLINWGIYHYFLNVPLIFFLICLSVFPCCKPFKRFKDFLPNPSFTTSFFDVTMVLNTYPDSFHHLLVLYTTQHG
jgi:hypothetical protein